MRTSLPALLLALGLILLGTASWLLISANPPYRKTEASVAEQTCVIPARVDFPAPVLSLRDLGLNPVRLESLQGDVVLLNTWATWCPPCLAEMPDLQEFFDRYRNHEFTLVGVNVGESRAQVIDFAVENQLTFPLWLDPSEESLRALNTTSLPYSIVIDRDGIVRYAWSGATCLSVLEEIIAPVIRQ